MSSTCARCRYPLTIDDSVVCYECNSCFHIDCAQLVGDPFYVFSSGHRNTFRCTTCELLPLPRTTSPSDSDDSEDMPSRQLDYPLSPPDDLAKEVHEVRGTVQDLQDLCKDIFREINELKSINLTLRCCVENLKHDNEGRDGIIAELKRRLDLLEKKNEVSEEDENQHVAASQYVVPSIKHVRIQEPVELTALSYEHTTDKEPIKQEDPASSDYTLSLKEDIQGFESEDEVSEWEKKDVENAYSITNEKSETENSDSKQLENKTSESDVYEAVKAKVISETGSSQHDWVWKGESDDVEIKEVEKREQNYSDEYDSGEDSEVGGAYGWQKLEDEIITETPRQKRGVQEEDATNLRVKNQYVKEGGKDIYRPETWADEDEENSEEEEDDDLQSIRISESEKTAEPTQGEEQLPRDAEEAQEPPEDGSEERKLPEGVEVEITAEGSEVAKPEPRLEGEDPTDGESGEADNLRQHEETLVEGEQLGVATGVSEGRLEADAIQGEPGTEGEERLKEGEGGGEEIPLPQEPLHTEEDLWTYLKETVTSVHPSTVEEFVQNLIGTLQHVPEEYLKPVIDANIKRAVSPSITDGEHLNTPDGLDLDGEPLPESSSPPEDGVSALSSADANTEVTPENTSPLENPPVEEDPVLQPDPEAPALPEGLALPETRTEEASYTALEDDV